MPKNVERAIRDFLNIHFVAKSQKIKDGPFGVIKKICEKNSHEAGKKFGQGRDSNPRPSAS